MVSENKRIAKNTLFLYMRMLLIMVVSLYTSRIILNVLGLIDFGINNVIGGIIVSLSFLTGSVSAGTSRFFAYEIGVQNHNKLSQYFKISMTTFLIVGIIILLIAETLGLWFVNTQLVIPKERLIAANWVYQFSIISFTINMLLVPYQSMIIARENMKIYTYISIIEVVLKLFIVYLLLVIRMDKLIMYAVLFAGISFLIFLTYVFYCIHKYKECSYSFFFDKSMFNEFASYSVWIIFGSISGIFRDQGINIVLNIFFGPSVNAARGIAYQVNRAISQFVSNFYTAVRPQITIRYAKGHLNEMYSLVFTSSRMCFYLIFVLSVPVIIQTPYILQLWLKQVPDMTVLLTRLVIITAILESLTYPLDTSITSTGKIRFFQIVTGGLLMLNLPISYCLLKIGYPPEITMHVAIIMAIIAHISRMWFAKKVAGVEMIRYSKEVLLIVLIVSIVIVIPINFFYGLFDFKNFEFFCTFTMICLLWSFLVIYFMGISSQERLKLNTIIIQKINRK